MFELTGEKIDVAKVLAAVRDPAAGAVVTFVGTTREHNAGRAVRELEYEAYAEMAVREFERIAAEAAARWPLCRVAIVHRVGRVPVGEPSVAIAVSAGHRDEAFAACRFAIDSLKARAPIWKKERFEGGEVWVEGRACSQAPSDG